ASGTDRQGVKQAPHPTSNVEGDASSYPLQAGGRQGQGCDSRKGRGEVREDTQGDVHDGLAQRRQESRRPRGTARGGAERDFYLGRHAPPGGNWSSRSTRASASASKCPASLAANLAQWTSAPTST